MNNRATAKVWVTLFLSKGASAVGAMLVTLLTYIPICTGMTLSQPGFCIENADLHPKSPWVSLCVRYSLYVSNVTAQRIITSQLACQTTVTLYIISSTPSSYSGFVRTSSSCCLFLCLCVDSLQLYCITPAWSESLNPSDDISSHGPDGLSHGNERSRNGALHHPHGRVCDSVGICMDGLHGVSTVWSVSLTYVEQVILRGYTKFFIIKNVAADDWWMFASMVRSISPL